MTQLENMDLSIAMVHSLQSMSQAALAPKSVQYVTTDGWWEHAMLPGVIMVS